MPQSTLEPARRTATGTEVPRAEVLRGEGLKRNVLPDHVLTCPLATWARWNVAIPPRWNVGPGHLRTWHLARMEGATWPPRRGTCHVASRSFTTWVGRSGVQVERSTLAWGGAWAASTAGLLGELRWYVARCHLKSGPGAGFSTLGGVPSPLGIRWNVPPDPVLPGSMGQLAGCDLAQVAPRDVARCHLEGGRRATENVLR